MMAELNELQSILHCSASASNVAKMVIDLGIAASKVNVSQTSFGHISINSPSILTVSMATESP